jgi:hypothetical protein
MHWMACSLVLLHNAAMLMQRLLHCNSACEGEARSPIYALRSRADRQQFVVQITLPCRGPQPVVSRLVSVIVSEYAWSSQIHHARMDLGYRRVRWPLGCRRLRDSLDSGVDLTPPRVKTACLPGGLCLSAAEVGVDFGCAFPRRCRFVPPCGAGVELELPQRRACRPGENEDERT